MVWPFLWDTFLAEHKHVLNCIMVHYRLGWSKIIYFITYIFAPSNVVFVINAIIDPLITVIWMSIILPRKFKERLFTAKVESVLLYGCETWTLTPRLEKQLNGCYTRMLRVFIIWTFLSETQA